MFIELSPKKIILTGSIFLLPIDGMSLLGLGMSEPISVFFCLLGLLLSAWRFQRLPASLEFFTIYFILLGLVSILTKNMSAKETNSVVELLKAFGTLGIFLVGYIYFSSSLHLFGTKKIIRLLAYSQFLSLVLAVLQMLSDGRAFGFSNEPSWFAMQCVFLNVLFFYNRAWKAFIMNIFCLILSASGVLLLYLCLVFAVFCGNFLVDFFVKWALRKRDLLYFLIGVTALILLTPLWPFLETVFQYVITKIDLVINSGISSELSTLTRLMLPLTAFEIWVNDWRYFLFGVGSGQIGFYFIGLFEFYAGELGAISSSSDPYFGSARSLILRIVSENGIIGGLLFGAFLFGWMKSQLRAYGQRGLYLAVPLVVFVLLFDTFASLWFVFYLVFWNKMLAKLHNNA